MRFRLPLVTLLLGMLWTPFLAAGQEVVSPQDSGAAAAENPAAATPPQTGAANTATGAEPAQAEPSVLTAEYWNELLAPLDGYAGSIVRYLNAFLFYPILKFETQWRDGQPVVVPLVIAWLILGAIFFTLRMGFINLRGFFHAISLTRGRYNNPEDTGEVSHFQALASALSATVGLGNIAGVAIAVGLGGPGAVFWMVTAGFLGMSSKFAECTLGQMYRRVRPDGRIMGGAMYYLSDGLRELGAQSGPFAKALLGGLGRILAILFAVFCIGGSFGGGNTFQVNQSLGALQAIVPGFPPVIYGLVMMALVGVVIIGGIKRIAATADKIVPFMCGVYLLAGLYILLIHAAEIPATLELIVSSAFSGDALYGGFIGVLIQGFRRAAFSNEAGVGSAAIAHSAARTEIPVREGIVALLEPFIDTVMICTMTGLIIVITGAYNNPEYAGLVANNQGAALTAEAFRGVLPWFPYVLAAVVFLFAYSTIISWSYYGERCWCYLFGDRASGIYRLLVLPCVLLGSVISSTNIRDLSDMMIFAMAFPNIFGVVLLSGRVRRNLDDYWARLKAGEFKTYQ